MTKREKIKFIKDLIASVQRDLLHKIDMVPDEWDGHELRRLIADRFDNSAMTLGRDKAYARRFRAYKNEVITRNL